jgi:hypothetical protein
MAVPQGTYRQIPVIGDIACRFIHGSEISGCDDDHKKARKSANDRHARSLARRPVGRPPELSSISFNRLM